MKTDPVVQVALVSMVVAWRPPRIPSVAAAPLQGRVERPVHRQQCIAHFRAAAHRGQPPALPGLQKDHDTQKQAVENQDRQQ